MLMKVTHTFCTNSARKFAQLSLIFESSNAHERAHQSHLIMYECIGCVRACVRSAQHVRNVSRRSHINTPAGASVNIHACRLPAVSTLYICRRRWQIAQNLHTHNITSRFPAQIPQRNAHKTASFCPAGGFAKPAANCDDPGSAMLNI